LQKVSLENCAGSEFAWQINFDFRYGRWISGTSLAGIFK